MEESVDMEDKNVTIKALRRDTITQISHLLNPTKHFFSENGLSRDWRGLAALCDIENTALPSIQSSNNQVELILQKWVKKDKKNSTVQKFLEFLEKIDRFDIIDDVSSLIDEDVRLFHQDPYNPVPVNPETEFEIITYDDARGQGPQKYDAFVLFADNDIDFATKLIKKMEDEYNLKFCTKDRDLVGGVFEHTSIIRLISERCNRLIVVLTTEFLHSPQNTFFYSYTQSLDNSQKHRKIIPCTYKDVFLPSEYRILFILDYKKSESSALYDFWKKLYQSVKVTRACAPTIQITPPPIENEQQIGNSLSSLISVGNGDNVSQRSATPTPSIATENNNTAQSHTRSLRFDDTPREVPEPVQEVESDTDAPDAAPPTVKPKKKKNPSIKKFFRKFYGHKPKEAAAATS